MPPQPHHARILVGLVAATGVLVLLAATTFGIGITPDSVAYLDGAHNLLEGRGLVVLSGSGSAPVPLTHYPPLFPGVLALAGSLAGSLPGAARWVNAVLFGANIFLVGLAIETYAPDSFWPPILGSFLTLAAPDIAGFHSFALSEPLFTSLMIPGLLCVAIYLHGYRPGFLILSAVLLGLAFATRYVGIVAIGTGIFALLVFHSGNLRRKLRDIVGFGALACVPMALWTVRNYFSTGGATDRQLAFHLISERQTMAGLSNLAAWFLVGRYRRDLRAFLIESALMTCLVLYLLKRHKPAQTGKRSSGSKVPQVFFFFIIFYLAFVLFTAIFVEADTVFDDRLLMPPHLAAVILMPCLAWSVFLRTSQARSIRVLFAALALIFAGSSTVRGVLWFLRVHRDGQGYAATAWKKSPTIARIRSLPDVPIYSNGFDAIYFLTGRPALYLPEKIFHSNAQPNRDSAKQNAEIYSVLRDRGGVLVYFHTFPERITLPSEQELQEQVPLRLVAAESDGSFYTAGQVPR